jgi:hypothetical protein
LILGFGLSFFGGWWSGAFAGDFAFSTVLLDGKLWWICGGLMVITWWLNAPFLNAKIFHFFQLYFLAGICEGVGSSTFFR